MISDFIKERLSVKVLSRDYAFSPVIIMPSPFAMVRDQEATGPQRT